MSLVIHGVPLSQPFRSIVWPCLIKGVPFTISIATPGDAGKYGTRRAGFLSKFPLGTVPSIEDNEICLSEAPAILSYLSTRHGWGDVYPKATSERAKVDEYLHWHHSNLRSLTRGFFRPIMFPHPLLTSNVIQLHQKEAEHALKVLEQKYLSTGASKKTHGGFLLGTSNPTAADFMAYEEIVQLEICNLKSFEAYPNIQEWLKIMKSLPFHDQVHVALTVLGDLTKDGPPVLERAAPASKAGLKAITAALHQQEQMEPKSKL